VFYCDLGFSIRERASIFSRTRSESVSIPIRIRNIGWNTFWWSTLVWCILYSIFGHIFQCSWVIPPLFKLWQCFYSSIFFSSSSMEKNLMIVQYNDIDDYVGLIDFEGHCRKYLTGFLLSYSDDCYCKKNVTLYFSFKHCVSVLNIRYKKHMWTLYWQICQKNRWKLDFNVHAPKFQWILYYHVPIPFVM
jgi:hypothetical protein